MVALSRCGSSINSKFVGLCTIFGKYFEHNTQSSKETQIERIKLIAWHFKKKLTCAIFQIVVGLFIYSGGNSIFFLQEINGGSVFYWFCLNKTLFCIKRIRFWLTFQSFQCNDILKGCIRWNFKRWPTLFTKSVFWFDDQSFKNIFNGICYCFHSINDTSQCHYNDELIHFDILHPPWFFTFTKTRDCPLNTRNNYMVLYFSNIEFLFAFFEWTTIIWTRKMNYMIDCKWKMLIFTPITQTIN